MKNAPAEDKPEAIADPYAWDPDPEVVVARTGFVFYFPAALLTRDPTSADRNSWAGAEGHQRRQDKQIAFGPGVTFLGAFTSSWALLHAHQAPQGPPPGSQMILVEPFCSGRDLIVAPSAGNHDPLDPTRLLPVRVQAVYARILRWLREDDPTARAQFATEPGFDAPAVSVMRLSALFKQADVVASAANAMVCKTIPHLRRNLHEVVTPLGALHDYAARDRHGGARAIMDACRTWAARKKVG